MTVSIIMPAYNSADFIGDAIHSVQTQTNGDWELIVINDGSTDGTSSILAKVNDRRIRVVHQNNLGASAARNAGLDLATREYVTFLDADDRLPLTALEQRVAYLDTHSEVDLVNGRVRVTKNGKIVRRYEPSKEIGPFFPRISRLDEKVFFGVCYMVRRSAIGTSRFPEGITHSEDLIFFLELAHDKLLTYGAVDADVYEYRLNPNSAMTDLKGLEAGYMALLRRAYNLERMTAADVRYLRNQIASILIKCWLRKGRPVRALSAGVRTFAAAADVDRRSLSARRTNL